MRPGAPYAAQIPHQRRLNGERIERNTHDVLMLELEVPDVWDVTDEVEVELELVVDELPFVVVVLRVVLDVVELEVVLIESVVRVVVVLVVEVEVDEDDVGLVGSESEGNVVRGSDSEENGNGVGSEIDAGKLTEVEENDVDCNSQF